jgi:AraC-like DNA-binding protein
MSRKRQAIEEADLLVRSFAVTLPSGQQLALRAVDWDQLAYASQGVMSVHTGEGTWVVPPHRAVWIPAGVEYRAEMSGRVAVRTLYFAAGLAASMPRRCQAVNVSPLLRELVLRAARHSFLRRDVAAEARLARVILDELRTLPAVPLQLPLPSDPRARRLAERLLASPGEPRPLALAAHDAGASQRTLERVFRRETHMTLGRWRQRLRLIAALRLLAAGHDVTRVALEVGYQSPSAFVVAFRRQLGTTPARYFRPVP